MTARPAIHVRHFALAMLAALLLLCGCSTGHVSSPPLTVDYGGSDPDTQMEFWHRLPDRSVASNDEAFHALLLFTSPANEDPAKDYAARVAALRARKMLPEGFDSPADGPVRRGTLAVALCRLLGLRGGLMMHLAGPTPRYATRELQARGIYPPSSPNQTFSGAELVGIIGRIEDQQRGNSAEVPAAVMPGEASRSGER